MNKFKSLFLIQHVGVFEEHKIKIVNTWMKNDILQDILGKYDIELDFFKKNYAVKIFDYYINVIKGLQPIGKCPAMDNFLQLLLKKDVPPHEIYLICINFRTTLINFCFEKLEGTQGLFNEITEIADKNLNGVLEKYEKIIKKKNKQIYEKNLLLEQYKQVVDESAIVSKADIKGKITYVNNTFCELSGYSEDELMGKQHNITRHPDMPKSIFKKLWKTIKKDKKIWQGNIKNTTKNGGEYIVATTIMPVLDSKGEILEYISVRYDVTQLYDLQKEIEDTQKEIVYQMGTICETRSKETGNHVKRVAGYSRLLALKYGLEEKDAELLYQASPMHDIGKVGIADHILNKPGKLTQEEFEVMKTHAVLGYEMFASSNRPLLKLAAVVSKEHHEKWDGSGYPQGLQGEDISIYGRITALADVFDALGSDRCYKKAWKDEELFTFIKEQSGKHFDPKLVELFFENLEDILDIREVYKD